MEIKSFLLNLLRLLRERKSSFEKIERYSGDKFFVWPYKDLKLIAKRSDFSIIKEIFYERRYSNFFPFKEKSIVLDIGAHNGYFCIFASRNLSEDSRIIGFEPISENYNIAIRNLEINGCKNVEIYKCGVSDRSGKCEIFLNKGNPAGHSLFIKKVNIENQSIQKRTISVISLDDLFSKYNIEHCDFLKIDCEGAEYPIFYSSSISTLNKIDTISMEFHDVEGPNNTGLKLAEYLNSKGGGKILKFEYDSTHLDLNFGKLIISKRL